MIQAENGDSIVATQRLANELNLGLQFSSIEDLSQQLRDPSEMVAIRERVWSQRALFTFDDHADRLITFLRSVMQTASKSGRASTQHGQSRIVQTPKSGIKPALLRSADRWKR
jgi:hypothetical protein